MMNAKQLREVIQARFKLARASEQACVGQDQNEEWKYWQGYKEALMDLMSADVWHAVKTREAA